MTLVKNLARGEGIVYHVFYFISIYDEKILSYVRYVWFQIKIHRVSDLRFDILSESMPMCWFHYDLFPLDPIYFSSRHPIPNFKWFFFFSRFFHNWRKPAKCTTITFSLFSVFFCFFFLFVSVVWINFRVSQHGIIDFLRSTVGHKFYVNYSK